jgi:ATP-dependent RNA helicase RhlE
VCVDETPLLRDIQRLLGQPIEQVVVPGFEPNREVRAEPIQLRSAEHRGPRGPRRSGRPMHAPQHPSPQHASPQLASAHSGNASYGARPTGSPAGQRRRQRPGRRSAAGSSIGNRWQGMPGERFSR